MTNNKCNAYQATTEAEDCCVCFLCINISSVEAVMQIGGKVTFCGPQVYLCVLRSNEAGVSTQIQLENLPIGSEAIVGPERNGFSYCTSFPPFEVVSVGKNLSKFIHSHGCHYFI